jgi:hypothetical protein
MFLNGMKARGISRPVYIELLKAAPNAATKWSEDPPNSAIDIIRTEIEEAMQD